MSGRAYLESIKKELEAGRHQHRMGESILAGFGYVRRRRSVVDEINFELERLGLHAEPPIGPEMPLRTPRIRFSLADGCYPEKKVEPLVPLLEPEKTALVQIEAEAEAQAETDEGEQAPPSSFRIGELAAADQDVGWVSQGASVAEAYTTMSLEKYSQLLVASTKNPRVQDVKGMISYKSIAKASLSGTRPSSVRDCLESVPIVPNDTDLMEVVSLLRAHDAVLVVGHDRRVHGIVTAWDLASEFAQLVDPFKRIGEVEGRLRVLLTRKLGVQRIRELLADDTLPPRGAAIASLDELTIGDLIRVIEHPDCWGLLELAAIDKTMFVDALHRMRTFRNRLMHFRDPLDAEEVQQLTRLAELVRGFPV